jgi:hypothetical protein
VTGVPVTDQNTGMSAAEFSGRSSASQDAIAGDKGTLAILASVLSRLRWPL